MKQFLHDLRPILIWVLLTAVIFFAVSWSLGKLFEIESLREISKFAFYISALAFFITDPFKPFCWAFRILAWLYHARPLASLPKDERRALVWSLFIAEAVCGFTYMTAVLLDSGGLRFVATDGFLVFSAAITILCLPLCFRCLVRIIGWLSERFWWSLLFLWRGYRWLNFRRIIYLALGFSALVLLFYAEEDFRGWRAWRNFKHEWEAKGERFDYASVIPPPVPDDQNFALTPVVASSYEWMLTKDGKLITPRRTNVVDRLRMNIYHWPPGDTVSGIQPTNGDWQVGKLCDLKSWQAYYRTPFTNIFWFASGLGGYWKPVTNPSLILTNDFVFPPTPRSPAADVLLALSKYNSDIEDLREASALPYSRFPLNYKDMLLDSTNPPGVMMMHLASITRCIQLLNLRAIAELENDQSDKALDDLKLELRLVNATRVEPEWSSQYYRTEELKTVCQAVWEGLAKHEWTGAHLAAIELELGELDFLADSQLALRGGRNETLLVFDYLRNHRPYRDIRQFIRDVFADVSNEGNEYQRKSDREKALREIYRCLAPSGSYYQNKVIVGIAYQQWSLNIADPAKHEVFPQIQDAGSKFVGSLRDSCWNSLARNYLPGSFSLSIRSSYAQEITDLARVACALERDRLAHGEYPQTLDALAPQFIDKIPHDIIGGKPLHYRRTDDGKYMLYSVGWNEVDDGGKIGLREYSSHPDISLGDWVWPSR